jgi:RNA polymerase-binding transcription factor DksA
MMEAMVLHGPRQPLQMTQRPVPEPDPLVDRRRKVHGLNAALQHLTDQLPKTRTMKHLTPSDLEDLATRLEGLEHRLRVELQDSGALPESGILPGAHEVHSHADDAEAERFDDVHFAEIEVDRKTLREVQAARKRMASGLYGLCLDCGDEIPRERLLAQPAAIRCTACQAKTEAAHRP